MSVKYLLFKKRVKRKLSDVWYFLMRPLSTWLFKSSDLRREEFRDSLTMERAVDLVARDIVRFCVKYNRDPYTLLSAEHYNNEYGNVIYMRTLYRYLANSKAKTAYFKFTDERDTFYELIIEKLKRTKGIELVDVSEDFEGEYYLKGLHWAYEIRIIS